MVEPLAFDQLPGAFRHTTHEHGVEDADDRGALAAELCLLLATVTQRPPGSFELDEADDFLRALEMDSIDAVELTIELDAAYDVRFGQEPDDVDHLKSFGSLIDLVLARGRVADS